MQKDNLKIIPKLHLGPMSKNVIHAVNDFAISKNWPICLIASRRQIDADIFGGGYVNNLSTETFSKKNILNINKNYITLARDHGGPYQGTDEIDLNEEEAIERALLSFKTDIISGLKIIHVDPRMCINKFDDESVNKFTRLTKLLLSKCFNILDHNNISDVDFEIGSDEGVCMSFTTSDWKYFLTETIDYTRKLKRRDPISLACPLGTKVQEIENTGALYLNNMNIEWLDHVQEMVSITKIFDINLKLHNADYVTDKTIKLYVDLGIKQFNIAPELGVIL